MRRILMGLLGLMLMFVVSGCGTTTALDTYSFGNKVVNVGASEIIVPTPFDLGKLANPTITDDGYPITLDGVPAVESTGLYTVKNKQIRFLQYTFISNGVLWNIAYQYAADSTVGAEALKLVEGKIQIIKKEG